MDRTNRVPKGDELGDLERLNVTRKGNLNYGNAPSLNRIGPLIGFPEIGWELQGKTR